MVLTTEALKRARAKVGSRLMLKLCSRGKSDGYDVDGK